MSWSVYAMGKPEAVVKKIEAEFDNITYLQGPEKELKELAKELLVKATKAYSGNAVVNITSSGHASETIDSKSQTLNISITPMYGFVE